MEKATQAWHQVQKNRNVGDTGIWRTSFTQLTCRPCNEPAIATQTHRHSSYISNSQHSHYVDTPIKSHQDIKTGQATPASYHMLTRADQRSPLWNYSMPPQHQRPQQPHHQVHSCILGNVPTLTDSLSAAMLQGGSQTVPPPYHCAHVSIANGTNCYSAWPGPHVPTWARSVCHILTSARTSGWMFEMSCAACHPKPPSMSPSS